MQDYDGKSDGSCLFSRQSHRKENNEMQNTAQQLKEKEERKNKSNVDCEDDCIMLLFIKIEVD